jgi:hypothetical protein
VVTILACLCGAGWSGYWFYTRAKADEARALQYAAGSVATQGEILDIQRRGGEKRRLTIRYRYEAGDRSYDTRVTVRIGDRNPFHVGSRVAVRYLRSRPEITWIEGRAPRATPMWPAYTIPPLLVLSAAGLVLLIRRQMGLLEEGRATLATVTKTEALKNAESKTWRVWYEWTVLSGAVRTGRYDLAQSEPPHVGSTVALVYDRDDPRRHVRYPVSLVRLAEPS